MSPSRLLRPKQGIPNWDLDRTESLRSPNLIRFHSENRIEPHSELLSQKWSSAARIAVFCVGIFGLAVSLRTRGFLRKGLQFVGFSSIIRAVTNLHVTDMIGWIVNPAIRLHRTIHIKAAVEDCYEFLSRFENYPLFMSYIEKVEVNEMGGLKWTAKGPAGILFQWNAQLKKYTKNQSISWKSSTHSPIRNYGDIELIDLGNENTLVQIDLIYAPPLGALGYAAVHFLGFDPKLKIDEDLKTLKSLIENESYLKFKSSTF